MTLFRFKADRLPITLITLYFFLDLYVFFTVDNIWFVAAWFIMGIWPKGNICAWNHHHQHCPTFRSPFMNRLLEIIYGFQTGITSKGWLLHHVLGHHKNYLDQDKDESRWMKKDGKTMSELRYSFEVAATSTFRSIKVGKNYPKQLRDYLSMYALQIVLLSLLFWYNWVNALFVFLIPMTISLLVTAWATFDHHSDLDTKNEYEGSRNITNRFYNIMTGNLGYHTAHHVKHGLHWSKVPDFHASIQHLIPASCYMEPGVPYSWYRGAKKSMKVIAKPFMRNTTTGQA